MNVNINQNYKKQFIFQVKATDSAPRPYELSSTAIVIIPVTDENDEAPMITVKFLGSSESTSHGETGVVKENVQPPIQLAYIQVRDADFNGNDQINCMLTDSVNFSLKPVNSLDVFHQNNEIHSHLDLQTSQLNSASKYDYILNLITKPDREKNPLYYVRIKCIDQASNFNEQTIRLRVLDMNDEQPRFQKSIYRFDLPENSDKQLKPFGYYRMDKVNSNNNHNHLTNQTLSTKLNETEQKEHKTEGTEDHYEYRIGRVLAEDNDQGENARVEYFLDEYFLEIRSSVSSVLPSAYLLINKQTTVEDKNLFIYHNENNINDNKAVSHELIRVDQLFRIDSHTGILYALKKFDGENVDMFRFNVFALDQPNQITSIRHSGTAIVEIKITDVNDWPPLFILTNKSNMNITDTTNYNLINDQSKQPKYQQHLNHLFSNENFTIDHHQQNDLHFVNHYVFHVKENRPAYWLIGQIMAIDLDVESKAMTYGNNNNHFNELTRPSSKLSSSLSYITLRLANNSSLEIRQTFNLHATNGYLRTLISLDREKQNQYIFNIIAYDGNPSISFTSQTSTATVTVIVDDENDNDPIFIRPAISSSSSSSSSLSSSAAAAASKSQSKLDLMNTQHKQYSINSLVHDKKENDFLTKQSNHLNVQLPASHDDKYAKNDKNQLKRINQAVNKNDNNDNLIQQTMQSIYDDKSNIPVVLVHRSEKTHDVNNGEGEASSLTESRPLLQIEAIDADIDENAKITYEIGAGNTDNLFVLNSETGILSLSPHLNSQSDHLRQSLRNTNLNQKSIQPITYMLRFEACDHGLPKRCASPIWVQLVIDPNEFPHLVQLSHVTNYINPSIINNHDKLNDPSYSMNPTFNGYIEQSKVVMLPDHVNSHSNTNNHIDLNKQTNGIFHEQENSLSSMEFNQRYPPKSTQSKNIWNLKSPLDLQQNIKNNKNQYPELHQQLFDSKRRKHPGLMQQYHRRHHENYINNDNHNDNNHGNNQSNSFIISEVAVVCLIIVFIILLIAIMILVYLTRRKTMLLPVTTPKSNLYDSNMESNPNSCHLNSNQDNSETICEPIELSKNTASFYQTIPDNMMNVTDRTTNTHKMSFTNDRLISNTDKSITLSNDILQNPLDSYHRVRRNSEPRLLSSSTLNRPTTQSTLHNLNKSTYGPLNSRLDVENEYQCLAQAIDNRITHISRCLTPFFDHRPHQTIPNLEAIGLNQIDNNYRNFSSMDLQKVNSPVNISHQSVIYTASTINNEENEQMLSSKTPTLIYAMSPKQNRHSMHLRGNSLPVYPVNELQQNSRNLKSFQHRLKPQQHQYRNEQHPISSCQDISLLQATLRRHNHQSIMKNAQINPTLNYGQHNANRLMCLRDPIHYKTFHISQHQDSLLTSPGIIYADNFKVCLPNKTRYHHYHLSSSLKDDKECQQLLVQSHGDINEDNDYICDKNITSSDQKPLNKNYSNNNIIHNMHSMNTSTTLDQLEEMPIYVKSSKNPHRKLDNSTIPLNNDKNISVDNKFNHNEDIVCNDTTKTTELHPFQCSSPTTVHPLPTDVDIDHHHHHHMSDNLINSKKILNAQNYDPQLISVNKLSKSVSCKYAYKTVNEASFV